MSATVEWIDFTVARAPELLERTGEHLILTGVSTGIAILIGVPLGIAASRIGWLKSPLLGVASILQTIPSLAMLALLLALLQKIGVIPAIIALTLYALLPIVRNTLTGLQGVSGEIMEAARGIGMTYRQELRLVKLPLALPVIMAGVRTAAVIGVGIATLAAFIGAGGLGQFIVQGLALADTRLILLGAVPAALLALLVDAALAGAEWSFRPVRQQDRGTLLFRFRPLARTLPLLLAGMPLFAFFMWGPAGVGRDGDERLSIRIGSKNFAEQFILGHLMSELIESKTELEVVRRFGLGGTMICHGALVSGEIDLYPEYTGTALTAILGREGVRDLDQALRITRREYRERWGILWLDPFDFDNSYTLAVRREEAAARGWETISDLSADAGSLRAGFTGEFMERPDGYRGLRGAYDLRFSHVLTMETTLMYGAVAREAVDVISAFATDGRIAAYDLKTLIDDRGFFPAYHAAPVVRGSVMESAPELRRLLRPLGELLDQSTMRTLNYEVDEQGRSPREVAREFLLTSQLIRE